MREHPEVEKLCRNVAKYAPQDVAEQIACGIALPESADDAAKAAWVGSICRGLEERFDEETIKSIRLGCHCDEAGRLDEMKRWLRGLYVESSGIEDFVDRVNRHNAGWYIVNGEIYTKFLGCECHMLQGVDRLTSKTWCYCTAGYTEELFRHVFGCEVESTLLQTIKMGHDACVVKIRINALPDMPMAGD